MTGFLPALRIPNVAFKQSVDSPSAPDAVRDDATVPETPSSSVSPSSSTSSGDTTPRTPTLFQRFVKMVGGATGAPAESVTTYAPLSGSEIAANVEEEGGVGVADGRERNSGGYQAVAMDDAEDSDWY